MKKFITTAITMSFFLALGASTLAGTTAHAGDDSFGYRAGSDGVSGWQLGPQRGRDGFIIYRQTRRGWQQVPGSAVLIGGSSENPWVINSHNRIFHWNGRDWDRLPGSATAVADGWVIGTNREPGGYGIFRWNGRRWEQAPGGAVAIGGSYRRPWVINDRNQRFVWNGYDWDSAGRSGYRQPAYSNSFRSDSDPRRFATGQGIGAYLASR
ncbi:MAG: hypothetical protein ACI95C_001975 [Pseudohongiellaceae bacterium]|jgi:hypothetical protein